MTPEVAQDQFIAALQNLARTGQSVAVRADNGNIAIVLQNGNYSCNLRPPEMTVQVLKVRV